LVAEKLRLNDYERPEKWKDELCDHVINDRFMKRVLVENNIASVVNSG
jgi:hypothetical protein